MKTDPIPTRAKTETLSVRLDLDASAVVRKYQEAWGMTGPETASALILVGAAATSHDVAAQNAILRGLEAEVQSRLARLGLAHQAPQMPRPLGEDPRPPKAPVATNAPKRPRKQAGTMYSGLFTSGRKEKI